MRWTECVVQSQLIQGVCWLQWLQHAVFVGQVVLYLAAPGSRGIVMTNRPKTTKLRHGMYVSKENLLAVALLFGDTHVRKCTPYL